MCISFALSAIADLLFKNDSFENYGLPRKVKNIYRLLCRLLLVANFVTCRSTFLLRLYSAPAVKAFWTVFWPVLYASWSHYRYRHLFLSSVQFKFVRIRMFLESHLLSTCTLAVDIRFSNFLSSYAQPAISLRLCLFFNVIGYCGKDGNRSEISLWSISLNAFANVFLKLSMCPIERLILGNRAFSASVPIHQPLAWWRNSLVPAENHIQDVRHDLNSAPQAPTASVGICLNMHLQQAWMSPLIDSAFSYCVATLPPPFEWHGS